MKTMVVYSSQTGFTEQYAKWIAEELQCDCLPLKKGMGERLSGCDRVIFGGWIMGGIVSGLNMLRETATPCAVFAVGSTPAYGEVIARIEEQNKLNGTPLYYMTGGFRFEKLNLLQRMLLKTLKKSVAKKENKNRQEEFMASALGTSFDSSAREQIKPLIGYLQG